MQTQAQQLEHIAKTLEQMLHAAANAGARHVHIPLTFGEAQAVIDSLRVDVSIKTDLRFGTLRFANRFRLPVFKNKHGQTAHSKPDGSDWSPAQWLQAVVGELGEYANFRKKFERGDLSEHDFEEYAAKELADVQTYLDILAMRALDKPDQPHARGIDLGAATMAKFNEVSLRVRADVFIENGLVMVRDVGAKIDGASPAQKE